MNRTANRKLVIIQTQAFGVDYNGVLQTYVLKRVINEARYNVRTNADISYNIKIRKVNNKLIVYTPILFTLLLSAYMRFDSR